MDQDAGKIKEAILFGGSFDPFHRAHLEMAATLLKLYPQSDILIIPTRTIQSNLEPVWKKTQTSGSHRIKMIELMLKSEFLEGEKRLRISRFELDEAKTYPSRTVETVRHFLEQYSAVHVTIGGDQFQSLNRWYHVEELCQLADFVVFKRKGVRLQVPTLPHLRFSIVETVDLDCSSQKLRETFANGSEEKRQSLLNCLTTEVVKYIESNRLYGVS